MKNRLIIFDFADTLAMLSPSKEKLLQAFIYEESNIMVPYEKIEEIYFYVTNLMFYSSVTIKEIESKKEFYINFNRHILSFLGLSHCIDAEKLFIYFKENGQHWTLKENVKEMLEELRLKNYKVSLVSNFDSRLYSILDDMKITPLFDSIFISQEVGLEKPDINFFRLPLLKHKIKAKNTFFIGDSYQLDFLPSISLGLYPILLDEKDRYATITESNKINSITDCTDIIYNMEVK